MDTQETTLFIEAVIVSVIVGIIISYFVVSIVRQQRRNLELSRKNALAELAAMEKERSRIANDLHDEISPILSVIKFQVISLHVPDVGDQRQVQETSNQLDNVIERLRGITNNLMPVTLVRKGLFVSLEALIRNLQDAAKIPIHFIHQVPQALHPEKSINIYRMIQELFHNTLRHADATEIRLEITVSNKNIRIFFKDNGKGFPYDKVAQTDAGLGLRSLKSRTELMGGKMQVESAPGIGTAFLFLIPL